MAPGSSIEASPKTESIQENWPPTLQVPLAKGLIWSCLIILEGVIVWELVSPKGLVNVFMEGMHLLLIVFLLVQFGRFELKKMVYYVIPPKRVFFFWIYVGIGLTAYYFPLKFPEGLGPQPPDFVFEYLCLFIVRIVLIPIQEEILFRGLFYGAIRTKYGKFKAYVISISIFVLSHRRLWPYIIEGYWDLLLLHLITLTVIACFLTYLYESKRSLLLCMAFHSSANINVTITPLLGFLYGGYIVGK